MSPLRLLIACGALWWMVWGLNGWRAHASGAPIAVAAALWLNVAAQLLNGAGRTGFEALRRRPAGGRLAAPPVGFALENASHSAACVSIALLIAGSNVGLVAFEVAVNAALLCVGLIWWRRRGAAGWYPFLVAWRISLPLTTLPVVLAIYAAGDLSAAVGGWLAAMALFRLGAIVLSDHAGEAALARDPRRLAAGFWWFLLCAGGAFTEMSAALALGARLMP